MKYMTEEFINKNMMGPSSVIIADELTKNLDFKKGMKILDLGCGMGLTSIFMAKKYNVQVFAVDLWISATDNFNRFKEMGVDDLVIPIHSDALNMPFSENYFDGVISVDSYHYFGNNDTYFKDTLKPLLKKDAIIAFAFPGMKYEVHKNIPEEMKPYWEDEALSMWHSIEWWKPKFSKHIKNLEMNEMECFEKAWSKWLNTDNPYAISDREMIATDNGKYMNLISIKGLNI